MRNPLQRLKHLPWQPLIVVASFTMFWGFVLELLLGAAYLYSPIARQALQLLFAPPLGTIMAVAAAVGVGALAVWFLEILFPRVIINAGTLWALVFCLLLMMVIAAFLPVPIPQRLIGFNDFALAGIVLGVFFKGKPYWR